MKALVISDTHVGAFRRKAPEGIWRLVDEAEVVMHLGDFSSKEFAERLSSTGKLVAVHGNCDCPQVKAMFPSARTEVMEGVRVGMTHALGVSGDAFSMAAKRYCDRGVSVVLYGHTHRAARIDSGAVVFFNPGTAGGPPRRGSGYSAGLLSIEGSDIDWRIVALDSTMWRG